LVDNPGPVRFGDLRFQLRERKESVFGFPGRKWHNRGVRADYIRQLTSAASSTLVAAAFDTGIVQTWDVRTGQKISEFNTIYDWGGFRLALSRDGTLCAAASWGGGKRGGVGCYGVQSSKMLWHRTDIRRTQRVRFAADGRSIYCGMDEGSVMRLSVIDGETLDELFDVEAVHESPCSSHTVMVCLSGVFLAEGDDGFRVPRVTFTSLGRKEPREVPSHLTGIAFGPESFWLAERGAISTLRCIAYTGREMWRIEVPKPTMIVELCYRSADRSFYGVECDVESGACCYLVRYSQDGVGVRICPLKTGWGHQGFCLAGDIIVTPPGSVIETASGRIVNDIQFTRKD
jgi:hypothetical protein